MALPKKGFPSSAIRAGSFLPSRAGGKGPECHKPNTNRRAAVYFPLSKGNQSKPGMQESSSRKRAPLVPPHPPARQRQPLHKQNTARGWTGRSVRAAGLAGPHFGVGWRGKPLAQGSTSTGHTRLCNRAFARLPVPTFCIQASPRRPSSRREGNAEMREGVAGSTDPQRPNAVCV